LHARRHRIELPRVSLVTATAHKRRTAPGARKNPIGGESVTPAPGARIMIALREVAESFAKRNARAISPERR
jgi:hypothetical protein